MGDRSLYLQNITSVLHVWNKPVILFGCPFGARLDLHVLHRRDKLINDQMLQADLSRQLSDAIHEVLPLTMDNLSDVVELVLCHSVTSLDSLGLLIDLLKLFLLRGEILLQLHFHVLLRGQVLFHRELLAAAFLKLGFRLEELLLLLHSLLHLFISSQKLLLHILDLLEKLLLLGFRLLLGLLLYLKVGKEFLTFFLCDGGLSFQLLSFFLELFADSLLVLFKSLLHLSHFLFVHGHNDIGSTSRAVHTLRLAWLSLHVDLASGKCGKLLS